VPSTATVTATTARPMSWGSRGSRRWQDAVGNQKRPRLPLRSRPWDEAANQPLGSKVLVDIAEDDLPVVDPDLDLHPNAGPGPIHFCHEVKGAVQRTSTATRSTENDRDKP